MGLVVIVGAALYIAMTVALSLAYVAPAARLANQWDTRLGGALADAVSCNAVVKAFGAEEREDRAARPRRRQMAAAHATASGCAAPTTARRRSSALLALRAAVIGTVLWLWWQGRATPGDVTYVLTTFFVIQGYLREVGMHIRNLQRSVNDMEELVDFHAEPIGVADRPGARPIRIAGGAVAFDRVTFHYAGHATPLYERFLGADRGGREGRAGRPLRLGQDDVRQAHPAALRRERGRDPDRRAGRGARRRRRRCARRSPSSSRSRSSSTARSRRTSPMARPGARHGGDRARGAARQRARVHRAAAERLRARWSASAA